MNRSHFSRNATSNSVRLERLGNSTYKTVQDMHNLSHSAGRTSGGAVTDNGNGTVSVASGTGFIRSTSGLMLYFFDWLGASIAIADGAIRYIGVEYNSGTPQIVNKASNSWSYTYDFPLAIVYREGADIHIIDALWNVYDNPGLVLRRLVETDRIARDELTGGLVLTETGTRNLALTAGALWAGLTRSAISAFNSSSNYAVTAIDQLNKTFTLSGDHQSDFAITHQFRIVGSTGNDGVYTVAGIALDSGNTVLTVDEAIPDGTADGSIYYKIFDRYYRDGATGWLHEDAQYQWNNTQYDNNAGSLTTLTDNRYSVQYFFIQTDGVLVSLFGQNQYSTLAEAKNEAVPNALPEIISQHSEIVGRIIFLKSGSSAIEVESAWDTKFEMSQATDHGYLAGLADDDHLQYLLLAGRAGGQIVYGGINAGDDLELHSTSNGTKGTIYIGGNSAYDEVNEYLGIGILVPQYPLHVNGYSMFSVGDAVNPNIRLYGDQGFYSEADNEIGVAMDGNAQFKFFQNRLTTVSGACLRNVVPSLTIPDICPIFNPLSN